MKILLVTFCFLFAHFCFSQTVNWEKTSHWKLYAIHYDAALGYTVDTLAHFKNIGLPADTVISFLSKGVAWPREKYALWMGLFVASFEDADGKLRKIDISVYGGFVYDEKVKQYYELPEGLRGEWMEFVQRYSDRIDQ